MTRAADRSRAAGASVVAAAAAAVALVAARAPLPEAAWSVATEVVPSGPEAYDASVFAHWDRTVYWGLQGCGAAAVSLAPLCERRHQALRTSVTQAPLLAPEVAPFVRGRRAADGLLGCRPPRRWHGGRATSPAALRSAPRQFATDLRPRGFVCGCPLGLASSPGARDDGTPLAPATRGNAASYLAKPCSNKRRSPKQDDRPRVIIAQNM